MLLLTFIVIVEHYQMLNRKKVEIYCRILVGDTIQSAILRYIFECLIILGSAFVISMIINAILGIGLTNNIYLSGIFVVYILISSRMVSKVENF